MAGILNNVMSKVNYSIDDVATMADVPDGPHFEEFVSRYGRDGHRAIGPARQSLNIRRSTNSSTVLLMGLSGAGKSHTINSLFSKEVAIVGDGKSVTKEIFEFTIKMPSSHMGIVNSKVHIIDTPGFGDSEHGIEFDAKVLANLRHLFTQKGHCPNFIVLAINFNDKRLEGQTSDLAKLLRAMKFFLSGSVLDLTHPNIIVTLTHLCGALPKHQKDPSAKIALVKQIILEHMGIDVPVEVVENCIDDYELPIEGEYATLPNGDLFPQNVYKRMLQLSKTIDPIGFGIINEAYPKIKKLELESQQKIIPILHLDSFGIDDLVSHLLRFQISTSTDIFDKLQEGWKNVDLETQNMCQSQPSEFSMKLVQLGYKELTDLPLTRKDTMAFFSKINANEHLVKWMSSSFNLTPPDLPVQFLVGRGFDITKDKVMNCTVLDTAENEKSLVLASIGSYVPKYLHVTHCLQEDFTFKVDTSKFDLMVQRLNQLRIQINEFGYESNSRGFDFPARLGYNLINHQAEAEATATPLNFTAVYEQKLLKVECKYEAPLDSHFMAACLSLPKFYDRNEAGNVTCWKNFFSAFGTHYVNSCYVGGGLVFEIENVELKNGDCLNNFDELLKAIYDETNGGKTATKIRPILPPGAGTGTGAGTGGDAEKSQLGAEFEGCTRSEDFWEALVKWKGTILEHPIVSDLSIGLGEIADLVSKVEMEDGAMVTNAMKLAIQDLYSAQLEIIIPQVAVTREEDSMSNRIVGHPFRYLGYFLGGAVTAGAAVVFAPVVAGAMAVGAAAAVGGTATAGVAAYYQRID